MVSALPPARAAALAREALANGSEEEALPLVASAAAAVRDDATLWQWTGLLHRACDDRRAALTAFANARRHAPHDPLLAHSEALTMLEAGLPAVEAFEQARTLAPTDAGVLLGLAASYVAAGESQRAAEDLRALLREHPGWLDGHRNLSHLAWTLGEGDDSDRSYRDALRRFPRDQALWQGLVVMLVQAGRFERALAAIADARSVIGDQAFLVANEAAARSELRQDAAADAAFARLAGISDVAVAIRRVRHLLRTARHDAARDVAEPWLDRPGGEGMWPYVGLAWRLLGDPRYPWLAGDAALVSVQDLSADVPDAGALERLLRSLHVARGQQYDQSVRGGTQTEGALLQRIEPEIVALRQAIVATVRRYVAQLPSVDRRHPFLGVRRDRPLRFAGSWSVRLQARGRHAHHVHPAGWISSALYVVLPSPDADDGAHPGWLSLGAPPTELGLDMSPTRRVQPRPLHLVLFPSIAWHGTEPFATGERMTVAFDVARPVGR